MKRAERIVMVQKVVDDLERRRAQALATCERQLAETEAKLAELEAYRAGYVRDFTVRAGSGMNAASARDYQTFLARLAEALRQQTTVVMRAKAQRDSERQIWQGAAQRADAVGHMAKRWNAEDRQDLERREQKETDDFSQRSFAYGMQPRGA
jgi:flagellar FliJ protein